MLEILREDNARFGYECGGNDLRIPQGYSLDVHEFQRVFEKLARNGYRPSQTEQVVYIFACFPMRERQGKLTSNRPVKLR